MTMGGHRAFAGNPGIAIVGAGTAARAHVEALRLVGLPAPIWVVARSVGQARSFASASGIQKWTDNLRIALEDRTVGMVVVATPSPQHAGQAVEALVAEKHVVVEIPVALSAPEAESMMDVAAAYGRRVFVCHTLRSLPAMREVKRRVEMGDAKLSQVTGFFSVPRRENEGRTGTRSWVDSLLWHHACHQVDASLWVLGFPTVRHIEAVEGRRHERYGMALDIGLVALTDLGQVITQSLSYNASVLHWELRFMGDRANLVFRNGALLDERGAEIVPEAPILDFRGIWSDVLYALMTGEASAFDLESIIPSMRVLQGAEDAMRVRR